MMDLLRTIAAAVPNWLKKFVGYGVASGLAMTMVLLAWLFWGTGVIQEKLGVPTKQDVQEVQDGVAMLSDDQLRMAIDATTRQVVDDAIGRLRTENDSVFDAMVKRVLEPGIKRQNKLIAEVQRLNVLMGLSNTMLEEQGRRSAQTVDRVEEMRTLMQDRSPNAELVQMLRAIQADNEEIMRKLKIQKQRF